jgi:predicted alpha/beta superfamily hydrolase
LARKRPRKEELKDRIRADAIPVPSTLTGTFRRHESFHSAILENTRDLMVYLPPDYEANTKRRYPVLYLGDGQNLFDRATAFGGNEWGVDEHAEHLIGTGEIEPLIVVGVYNTGEERIAEYTPTADPKHPAGGKGHLYGRFLVEELKPFVDGHYRTAAGRENTGLGGSSLGGLIALYTGLRYPGEFGKLAVMSPSGWWDRKMIVRYVHGLLEKPPTRIWLDIGTNEGRQAHRDAVLLRDKLCSKGWKEGEDLAFMEAEGADHSEGAWSARVPDMLKFLFPGNS